MATYQLFGGIPKSPILSGLEVGKETAPSSDNIVGFFEYIDQDEKYGLYMNVVSATTITGDNSNMGFRVLQLAEPESGVTNTGILYGCELSCLNQGDGTVTSLAGLRCVGGVLTGAVGSVTSAHGVWANVNGGSGALTNAFTLRADLPTTGTITNVRGVTITSNSSANATNKYGLYIGTISGASNINRGIFVQGTSVVSEFQGNVQARTLTLTNLPTTDPGVAGQVWVDAGAGNVLKVSTG
jgi:hypothetical protein